MRVPGGLVQLSVSQILLRWATHRKSSHEEPADSEHELSSSADLTSQGKYADLADCMGRWPELAPFRWFRDLQSQNSLFLQAELANYQAQLDMIRQIAQEESSDDADRAKENMTSLQHWLYLAQQGSRSDEYCKHHGDSNQAQRVQ